MSDNELDPNIIGNQIPKERPQGKFYLRKGVGSWSAGTQVNVLDEGVDTYEVEVLAGDNPIIEVYKADIIERRARS